MDIKGDKLIKTIMLEGIKTVGNLPIYKKIYDEGADEIFLNDAVASLYRNSLFEEIEFLKRFLFLLH